MLAMDQPQMSRTSHISMWCTHWILAKQSGQAHPERFCGSYLMLIAWPQGEAHAKGATNHGKGLSSAWP